MSVNALAKRLGIPTSRLNDIVLERRGVTPDTARRLARCFGVAFHVDEDSTVPPCAGTARSPRCPPSRAFDKPSTLPAECSEISKPRPCRSSAPGSCGRPEVIDTFRPGIRYRLSREVPLPGPELCPFPRR